ncbi:MAG: choice-of-anchor D domain-containing protein [Candidatus Acidiferrum sp.]
MVLISLSAHPFLRSLSCASGLLLICLLGIGCAGSSQNTIPGVSLSAKTLTFDTVVGEQATQSVSITNTSNAPLQVARLAVSNQQFSVAGPTVPLTIQPSSTATYNLTFSPTSAGDVSGTVNFSTSASYTPASVRLKGHGASHSSALVINPSVVSFGNQTLKTTATQNVTLQNTGSSNVALQGVTVSGAGFGYSDLSPGFSLAPNQKVTFQVWFDPKVTGPASATLTLLGSNLSSPGTLSMSGDGVNPGSSSPTPAPVPTSQHTVDLSWSASSSQVIGYRVYRSETSGGSYSALNGTAITALAYADSTVASGTTYYYVVTSVDSAGTESVYSNQATAVIP